MMIDQIDKITHSLIQLDHYPLLLAHIIQSIRATQKITTMASTTMLLGNSFNLHFSIPKFQNRALLKTTTTNRAVAELGFVTSQLSGLKISYNPDDVLAKPIVTSFRPSLQPVARRVCPFTGKKSNKANLVSFSNHKTIKRQFVNLQYKRIWWEAGKCFLKLRLSTKAIKTIEKNGLDAVAKKAGIDLRKL